MDSLSVFQAMALRSVAQLMSPAGRRASLLVLIYLFIALLVLAPVVFLAVLSALARKPSHLGVADGRLADCPASPNCVSTQATDEQHGIKPLVFTDNPEQAVQRLKAVIAGLPRMKIVTDTGDYLHAEAVSLLEQAAVADPQFRRLQFLLGRAYQMVGREKDAQLAFERFRKLAAQEDEEDVQSLGVK